MMNYRLLGRSGLRVSELALGTMTFGEEWGWGASKTESRRMFDMFADRGGNFIDTANRYTEGTSETFVGEFVAKERQRFVVATKYTLKMRDGDPNAAGNHRKNLTHSLDASLKRLKLDYIDLYWLHAWDYLTPVEEIMRALDDAVSAGKILYTGISDTPAWIVSQANTIAVLRGWTPFIGLQIEYSLIERTVERELVPMARALGLGIAAWAPIGGGILSGKYQGSDAKTSDGEKGRIASGSAKLNDTNINIVKVVGDVARETGRTQSQVAINWLRQQPGVVIPLIGARKASQLEDNLACLEFELSPEQIKKLTDASSIVRGFPHDFLNGDLITDIVYAGTLDRIKDRPEPFR